MFARQALTIDHISNGRVEIGLGLGLTVDLNIVKKMPALGMSEFNLYYPMLEEQMPMSEHIARNVFPQLKADFKSGG